MAMDQQEADMRREALFEAIRWIGDSIDFNDLEVVAVAEVFYLFLSGQQQKSAEAEQESADASPER